MEVLWRQQMSDTCVREIMARCELPTFIVRCWVPFENIPDNNKLSEFIFRCKSLADNHIKENNYLLHTMDMAEFLCRHFNMNACEVICKSDMCGAVFYREWP
jgi:hypothetical protein